VESLRIGFFAEGDLTEQSAVHRVITLAKGLGRRGHETVVVLGSHFLLGDRNIMGPSPKSYLQAISSVRELDALVIHRTASYPTAALIGFANRSGVRTIYDFDDALYLVHNPFYAAIRTCINSVNQVAAGSHELLAYASAISEQVILLPASVDTDLFNPRLRTNSKRVTIGWIGHGPVNRRSLTTLLQPLERLSRETQVRFKLVSPLGDMALKNAFRTIPGVECDFGPDDWRPLAEMPAMIADFDVGVMPLVDSPWSRGKCGQKLVEYMAMGIPVVASAIGENNFIVDNNRDGFLVRTTEDWVTALRHLVEDETLRLAFGKRGRTKAERKYSLDRNVRSFEEILHRILDATERKTAATVKA